MKLNESAQRVIQELAGRPERYHVSLLALANGACVVDCGIEVTGGLEAGRLMAEACMAGLGHVQVTAGDHGLWSGPWISVTTDHPVAACMASQYAGWPISCGKYFAMGSGPMRAARGREPLFEKIGCVEQAPRVAGILESGRLPDEDVAHDIARQCHVEAENVTLLVAPTSSLAGTIQVVARSVETALHKMCELDFDISRVVAGHGTAPLPPVAADDLVGIGRTNDAVLYGGLVTLWLRGDDASLQSIGPRIPSCDSSDHGRPFAEIFEHYERDFYRIDPLLFSPGEVHLVNLESGNIFRYGRAEPAVIARSFLGG